MNNNYKIKVSKEVSDFIKSHFNHSVNNSNVSIFWDDCKYISTDEDCVFEVIFQRNIIDELLKNRLKDETKDNN